MAPKDPAQQQLIDSGILETKAALYALDKSLAELEESLKQQRREDESIEDGELVEPCEDEDENLLVHADDQAEQFESEPNLVDDPFSEDWVEPYGQSAGFTFGSLNGLEFIAVEPPMPLKVCQLQCSARIFYAGMEILLHSCGSLMLLDDSFVARVRLMDIGPLMQAANFSAAARALFRQLCISEIYVDKLMAQRDHLRSELLATFNCIRQRTTSDNVCAVDALQIFTVVQCMPNINYTDLCEQLCGNTSISHRLRDQAKTLLQIEQVVEHRNAFLAKFHFKFVDSTRELIIALQEFRGAIVASRVKSLLDMAPDYLERLLKKIPDRTTFQIHNSDVKVFHDLDKVMNKEIFEKPLHDLAKRWTMQVKALKQGDQIVSVISPIYFSLCRSLEELIVEIADRTDHKPEELLLSDDSGWHPLISAINWKSISSLTKCLQQEYNFIFRLLKHFDPVTGSKNPFEYRPRRLLAGETAEPTTLDIFLWPFRRMMGQTPQKNPLGVSDELYVWFCLLDDVLHHALPQAGLDTFEQILHGFVRLVRDASLEQMETIRVITHNTARFIVQTYPFVAAAQSGEDKEILQAQLGAINRLVLGTESATIFRDLVDVFSGYWKNRSEIVERIPAKNEHPEMEQIKNLLLKLVGVALRKDSGAGQLINLFRSFNDLLIDLDDVSFDWLIKSVSGLSMVGMIELKLIEPADNRWNGTANQTYRVIEPRKFQQLVFVLLNGASSPKHYVIEVVSKLLGYIHSQLNHADWPHSEQVASSSVLIASIRSSLIYLRDQADYVSFDLFAEESTKPFGNVIENSRNLADFNRRVGLIKESFCYLRKQNEMSLVEALQKYEELNGKVSYDKDLLQQAYAQYSNQFEAYMAELNQGKAAAIAKQVRKSVAKPNLFKNWTAQFKREELPKILAGVAAVWSVMVSEDVSSTGKFFKPHCIQVLCVLRLLGADRDEHGASKHLAQVLTGQGKSLVLALIATILASTGHEVQLVCYNEYLVKRDSKDFADLYELFGVKEVIQYGTFEDMANAIIAPEVDGEKKGLRTFVRDLILAERANKRPSKPKAKVQDNSVLLMDEVDVFFTKEYYGSTYCPITTFFVSGLEEIQEEIWYNVNSLGDHDVQRVTERIQKFMSSSRFVYSGLFSLLFLSKPKAYDLLVKTDSGYERITYSNKTLFDEHLNLMISNAIQVVTKPLHFKDYKLNHEGVLIRKIGEKWYTDIVNDYMSTFHYFRLKKNNFVRYVPSDDNYGYLNIECGSISYAMLPKAFPLILGVTGTLTSLNQYEKTTIERLYNITHSSIMPSFFGCSNVHFNPIQDFTLLSTRPLWISKIFSQAYAAVTAKRAVLIFFFNGNLLEEFRAQYCGQFDRLQVLTENTAESQQEHLINEAGIAKTVTLATRGMGRGVDYKSSVAVEKSGGVHVIQTFFSLDVKEETQIRGRTARKDNRGSYELIVYDVHLKAAQLVEATGQQVTYAELDAARASIALKENRDIEESIRKNTGEHTVTMEYLQSFFK